MDTDIEGVEMDECSVESLCEMVAARVTLRGGRKLFLLGAYRPPAASLDKALACLSDALDCFFPGNGTILLVGDLNVNGLKHSKERTALSKLLAAFGLHRINLPATRITETSETSIDVVCSNQNHTSIKVDILHNHLSDHTGQLCDLSLPVEAKSVPTTTRRNLCQQNIQYLKDLLGRESWEGVLQASHVDDAYSNFINLVTIALNHACPYKTSRVRTKQNKKELYDTASNELRVSFIEAQNRFLLTRLPEDKLDAANKKKIYDLKLKSIRREANERLIMESSNRSKAIWTVINAERTANRERGETIKQLNIDGKQVNDPNLVAHHLNYYFTNIADDMLRGNSHNLVKNTQVNYLTDIPGNLLTAFPLVTHEEISNIIKTIKPKPSAGFDDIRSIILKKCQDELLLPLIDITNKSLSLGVFPAQLKISKVRPLHKKGSRDNVSNYRPISLVPTFGKVIERVVLSRIRDHLECNNIILDRQHGFMPGRSTITALAEIIEYIVDELESGNTLISTFLDLSKAFDSLDHEYILSKLEAFGIKDTALAWFRSYLNERWQQVGMTVTTRGVSKTIRSSLLKVKRGVPQGSVLGPMLFALFTADLPNYVGASSLAVMFADDTTLLTSNKSAEQLEITNFIAVSMAQEYCSKNDLVFNDCKTTQMIFGRNKNMVSGPPYIQKEEFIKHLGVVLDEQLSWSAHVESLCSKLSAAIFALKRVRAVSTEEAVKSTYYALFESQIRYGIIFWAGCSCENLQRVLILQKRAMRVMMGLQPDDSCRQVFKRLNVLTVVSLYICEVVVFSVNSDLKKNGVTHNYNTRNADNYNLPQHRTSRYSKKPSYAGAKYYNIIPAEVKRGPLKTLKKRLQKWLLNETLYSLQEFHERATGAIWRT